MAVDYSFITEWKVKAPVARVWDALYETEHWPQWWKSVIEVQKLKAGDDSGLGAEHAYLWTSLLPYRLRFSLKVTEIERYKIMKGISRGELEGTGTWQFEEKDGYTIVTNYWNVRTEKRWMNRLSFLLGPVFRFNHRISMQWGAKGLGRMLGAEVAVNGRQIVDIPGQP